jgi:hypothetical protein
MPWKPRLSVWLLLLLLAAAGYGALRTARSELVDFEVVRTAAARLTQAEPLYRPADGHYQFKYLPTIAATMVPFAWLPHVVAEALWFGALVIMAWALVRLSIGALPNRRLSLALLAWLAVLLNAKALLKELAFGQFNLPLALLLIAALMAAQRGRGLSAGALIGAAVFVKPYALVMVPWVVWTHGWRTLVPMTVVLSVGLAIPALFYGWDGNIDLLQDWFRTVSETTGPNLMVRENVSFLSLWTKWIGPGTTASWMALVSSAAALAVGTVIVWRRQAVDEPHFLEASFLFVLIPLLSPQGWDYVLLLALPAYVCVVDRWGETPPLWRAVAIVGFALTSFAVYDLMRRTLYFLVMDHGGGTLGAVLIALGLLRLRWKALA